MLQSEFLPQVRRFLTTLHQFAADISPEVGDRVRHLVLGLLVSASCRRWSSLGDDNRLPQRLVPVSYSKGNLVEPRILTLVYQYRYISRHKV